MPVQCRTRILSLCFVLGAVCRPSAPLMAAAGEYPDLAAIAAADTTPSNIWIVRAMFTEILGEIETRLPPRPSRIVLRPLAQHEAIPLFQELAVSRLGEKGHELFLDDTNIVKSGTKASTIAGDVDLILRFSIEGLALGYPDSGRRFGLWRQWVDREMELVMFVGVDEAATGRVLMDQRLVRAYDDRVPAGRFQEINSPAYSFTHAEVAAGGFRGIFENLVVVGTLTGLIAIYFANSGS